MDREEWKRSNERWIANNSGGTKRRAITEDAKDKRNREIRSIWERMKNKYGTSTSQLDWGSFAAAQSLT